MDNKISKKSDTDIKNKAQNPEQVQKELEEWKNKYLRALADYQNLEKRVIADRTEQEKFATKNFIIKILSVLDVLEQAEKVLKDQGIKLTIKQFRDVLKSEQVEKIEVLGKKFNPNLMECVEVVAGDNDDEIVEEVRDGYTMWGKVIRVAQVKVGKKTKNRKAEELAKK